MNVLDILILIPIIYGAYKGFKGGFILQITTLIAIFTGIYVALRFTTYLENILDKKTGFAKEELPLIAFILLFIAVGAGIYFLGRVIKMGIKSTAISPLDKLSGLTLGVLKTTLIVGICLMIFTKINDRARLIKSNTFQESILYPHIVHINKIVWPILDDTKVLMAKSF